MDLGEAMLRERLGEVRPFVQVHEYRHALGTQLTQCFCRKPATSFEKSAAGSSAIAIPPQTNHTTTHVANRQRGARQRKQAGGKKRFIVRREFKAGGVQVGARIVTTPPAEMKMNEPPALRATQSIRFCHRGYWRIPNVEKIYHNLLAS